MVQLARPIDVRGGILSRARALPLRLARSYTRHKAWRSITVSSKKRNHREGCNGPETAKPQLHRTPADRLPEVPEEQKDLKPLIEKQVLSHLELQSRLHRLICDASNSVISDSTHWNDEKCTADMPDVELNVRRGLPGTSRRHKSVSVTSMPMSNSHNDDVLQKSTGGKSCVPMHRQPEFRNTRSIIKKRDRTVSGEKILQALHNASPSEAAVPPDLGPGLDQQRLYKILERVRFIPHDTFYKKIIVAPNKDGQMFAAPQFSRGSGSPMLYDIANQNNMHHRDVNFDFMRDSLRKSYSTFQRTSRFRNGY